VRPSGPAGISAGAILAASGDLIHTGPTGTHVMDLMIGLKVGAGDGSG
jgi:hydroxypyruvate reductase